MKWGVTRILVFGATLVLAGCVNLAPSANTVQTFALGPGEALAMEPSRSAAIYIERPDLPGYVRGDRLVYRADGGRFQTIGGALWVEPMGEGVARATGEWIAQVSDRRLAGYYPWPASDRGAALIRLRFPQLIATGDGAVHVAASWRIRTADDATREGEYASEGIRWNPGDPKSLVKALNAGLRELAVEIAGDL